MPEDDFGGEDERDGEELRPLERDAEPSLERGEELRPETEPDFEDGESAFRSSPWKTR